MRAHFQHHDQASLCHALNSPLLFNSFSVCFFSMILTSKTGYQFPNYRRLLIHQPLPLSSLFFLFQSSKTLSSHCSFFSSFQDVVLKIARRRVQNIEFSCNHQRGSFNLKSSFFQLVNSKQLSIKILLVYNYPFLQHFSQVSFSSLFPYRIILPNQHCKGPISRNTERRIHQFRHLISLSKLKLFKDSRYNKESVSTQNTPYLYPQQHQHRILSQQQQTGHSLQFFFTLFILDAIFPAQGSNKSLNSQSVHSLFTNLQMF